MTPNKNQTENYLPKKGGKPAIPWLWLGAWSLGGEGFGPGDGRESVRVLGEALDAGIRHIDTAGIYAHGRSEELIAKVIGQKREDVFISTKGGLVWQGRKVLHRAGAGDLRRSLMESLDRLKTDYIDLFQLHWPDPKVPISDSLDALKELQDESLIRFYGMGNLSAAEVKEFIQPGLLLPHQVHYNPIHQARDILGAGRDQDRCFNCVVSPLEQGLLTDGESSLGLEAIGKRDIRRRNPHFHSDEVCSWLLKSRRLSSTCPIPKVSLILLWILAHDQVDAVIPGPRTLEQLNEVLEHKSWIRRLDLGGPEGERYLRWMSVLRKTIGEELWSLLDRGPYYIDVGA